MKYVNFPGTDEKISVVGLGTWVIGGENWGGAREDEGLDAVREALHHGINFIDTAPFYGDGLSETLVGRSISGCRDKVFLATKCGLVRENGRVRHDLSAQSVSVELDASRRRLQSDVIDLYQCHWPDPNTPVEKTMEALLRLKNSGKIRYIGVSNFDLSLLKRSLAAAPVSTLQVPYSLLDKSIEGALLPFCLEKGIGVIAYGPMGGGILTGKYQKEPPLRRNDARSMFYKFYQGEGFKRTQEKILKLKSLDLPLNEVALNWVRQQSGITTVLAGCRNAAQVALNVRSLTWDLSVEHLSILGEI